MMSLNSVCGIYGLFLLQKHPTAPNLPSGSGGL